MTSRPLIGLTQRLTLIEAYQERRDSLARDWYPFMAALGLDFVPLPNDPGAALNLARRLDLGGLILTGGEDIGSYSERDETETGLLSWAAEANRPVIGVCRGFQFICRFLGGELHPVNKDIHVAARHEIVFSDGSRRTVNSYHKFAPHPGPRMEPIATCPTDNTTEAAKRGNLLGISWHPEREKDIQQEDIDLFLGHFEM